MKTADELILEIDAIVDDPKWHPYQGYDGHKPMGSLQQSRPEFHKFIQALVEHDLIGGTCLQLGLGPSRGTSHAVWMHLFNKVVTLDEHVCKVDLVDYDGVNTHSPQAINMAKQEGPYDCLFIDAGHFYTDVNLDHQNYSPLVCTGGIIGFHDACRRPDIPIHEVWRYLEDFHPGINMITDQGIGIAWYVK